MDIVSILGRLKEPTARINLTISVIEDGSSFSECIQKSVYFEVPLDDTVMIVDLNNAFAVLAQRACAEFVEIRDGKQ